MLWALQNNIVAPNRYMQLISACEKLNIPYVKFRAYPDGNTNLSNPTYPKIPTIRSDIPVIFCATTFAIRRVYESKKWYPGTYFNPDTFIYTEYNKNYGDMMINFDSEIMTIGDLKKSDRPMNQKYFIRPIKDLKEFTGLVIEFREIKEWDLENDKAKDYATLDTEIIVSNPVSITKEWRLFIVKDFDVIKVVSGSQYIQDHKFHIDIIVPNNVLEFALTAARKWTPAPVFVMDIAEIDGKDLKIIECNCFNCSGFYGANVEKIVGTVDNMRI